VKVYCVLSGRVIEVTAGRWLPRFPAVTGFTKKPVGHSYWKPQKPRVFISALATGPPTGCGIEKDPREIVESSTEYVSLVPDSLVVVTV
jgi:hypothetical protein